MSYYNILSFRNMFNHMIWIRFDVVTSKIKHLIIGTVFVTGPWDERAYARPCTEISSGTGHGLLTDDCLLLLSG